MATQRTPAQVTLLESLMSQAQMIKAVESEWKARRADLRFTACQAVIEQKLSLATVAEIAGINRKTLTIWVQIRQAEIKGAAQKK